MRQAFSEICLGKGTIMDETVLRAHAAGPARHVHHALRQPQPAGARPHLQRGQGRTFDLYRRPMHQPIYRLTPGRRPQVQTVDLHPKATEQHAPGGHLEYQLVKPLVQQVLQVRRLQLDGHFGLRPHPLRRRDHGRHGQRHLLEGLGRGRADPAHTDVRLVVKMLPERFLHLRRACVPALLLK